jgi:hypothetical protein
LNTRSATICRFATLDNALVRAAPAAGVGLVER